ncbi:MAG: hypothetical protein CMO81_05155 [Waddliaceae bacterium]|nr:hypothetical protein [Waddliaceae bacterium]
MEQNPFFSSYYWSDALPYGLNKVRQEEAEVHKHLYKIVSDPYHKHVTIESYLYGCFDRVVYDSLFLDFRHLHPQFQTAWEKQTLSSDTVLIRDQDDRVRLIEQYRFEEEYCVYCETRSAHGFLISQQEIMHRILGASIDGLLLKDSAGFPVMFKEYSSDKAGQFIEVQNELWQMRNFSLEIYKGK